MVKISDIIDLLETALCFTNIDDYNKYLSDVRKIGLDWKKVITDGKVLGISDNNNMFNKLASIINPRHLMDNNYKRVTKLHLFFIWDKVNRSHIYIKFHINGVDLRLKIKSKPKFLTALNAVNNCEFNNMKRIFMEQIEDFKPQYMYSLIKYGLDEFTAMKNKGLKLVEETINSVNTKEETCNINGTDIVGYILYGNKTKTKYFISKDNLSVFRFENGHWNSRCVVEDRSKNRIFEDKLANRLVNIYNEPERIFTLYN